MTFRELGGQIRERLRAAGILSADYESNLLIEVFFQLPAYRLPLMMGETADPAVCCQIEALLERRCQGYPLQYLLGTWEFYGLEFCVGEGVLIPRQDTEIVVDAVLEAAVGLDHPVIADLCSGSGCIAVAAAANCQQASLFAVELSEQAFPYLIKNIAKNRIENIEAIQADVLQPYSYALPPLDILVSNPPYIPTLHLDALQREVQFEPRMALDGTADGLHFYRELTRLYREKLKPGGKLIYEIGYDQGEAVTAILKSNGFCGLEVREDYGGLERVVLGTWNG